MGLAPEQGKGIEYEFDLLVELTQLHQGIISKDRTSKFQDEVIDKPGEEFGIALYDWLSSGNAVLPPLTMPPIDTQSEPAEKTPAPEKPTTAGKEKESTIPTQPKATGYKAEGEAVITQIGTIINTASPAGQLYFSEGEIADARLLIGAVKMDAKGLKDLKDFCTYLASELEKRQHEEVSGKAA
jgi:hypothetical protein